ncbi:acyltransferase [Polynucleobacter paneuropaeus]|nr:acyltransferase [Polynucleobacter paneuropaeus]
MLQNIQNRNQFLDIAKGIAIILVILGHTFQGLSENFDDSLGFRIIYSFHMPLFVFISGMVFSFTLKRQLLEQSSIHSLLKLLLIRIQRSFIRLIIPFTAWTIIGYFINHRYEASKIWELKPLFIFLIKVLHSPDWSLWFLVCVFYCIVVLSFFEFCLAILRLKCNIKNEYLFEIALLILSFYIAPILRLVGIGTGGFGFLISYLIFFTLGYILAVEKIKRLTKKPWIYACIPLFTCLVLLWHRTTPHHLVLSTPKFIALFLNNNLFGGLVALLGSMVVLLLVEYFSKRPSWIITKLLAQCGVLSLGIYAIHFYLLAYKPPVIAPLLISIIITLVIQKIPILRVALLGEALKKKPYSSNAKPVQW